MNENNLSFGAFLQMKRKAKKFSQSFVANAANMSTVYLCDIERDRRNPPDIEILKKIANVLDLSTEEENFMYDLAGTTKGVVAPDLPDYIKDKDIVKKALRMAKEMDATEDDWIAFIGMLNKEKK